MFIVFNFKFPYNYIYIFISIMFKICIIKICIIIPGNPELYSPNNAARNSMVCLSIVMLIRLYGII